MFEGFHQSDIETDGATIRTLVGGDGPPLLLLHGYPQTHVMWHKIAPKLADDYTVVATDLRGYGDSSKPESTADHSPYSFRAMANDQVQVMQHLGFEKFAVAGHDRGARTAHRMALDHQEAVTKLALLDIVPTLTLYDTADQKTATSYYHWYFLIQDFDLPEKMIGSDPEYYLRKKTGHWSAGDCFTEEAMADYIRCFSDPATIHASCEDYRAGASLDLEFDRGDRDAENKISCPTLVLWGEKGAMGKCYDVLETWQDKCETVSGAGLPCGHFLAEEAPDETYAALSEFFKN
jgi:haloacetate dehalogenase